jgi:4-amino-4-deoxy-L-arabinose transferase-like glycosyltransferase
MSLIAHRTTSRHREAQEKIGSQDSGRGRLATLFGAGALTLLALIPRLALARQLDVTTDEPIYAQSGARYIQLLRHFDVGAQDWLLNYEHPAFAKLLMGIAIHLSHLLQPTQNMLFAARLPSVLLGALLVGLLYAAGGALADRRLALLAALTLAWSPWAIFLNAQATLDTTMTTLISSAFLVLWFARTRPRLYLLWGVLMGLAGASKYPAALVVPGMLFFVLYDYSLLQRRLPPWRHCLAGLALVPSTFFLADPLIWADPLHRLAHSLRFSLHHAHEGHLSFWAGHVYLHVPGWLILYVLVAKVSAVVTIPAAIFALVSLGRASRQHLWPLLLTLRQGRAGPQAEAVIQPDSSRLAGSALIFCWLVPSLLTFSRLTILVGTHYYLPILPALMLAGAAGLLLLCEGALQLWRRVINQHGAAQALPSPSADRRAAPVSLGGAARWQSALGLTGLVLLFAAPHLWGLLSVNQCEGYTSEFFAGENASLQVAYAAYREAYEWLQIHSQGPGSVGLVGGPAMPLWYVANPQQIGRLRLVAVEYGRQSYPFTYLVWPMHLIQRHIAIPAVWRRRIVHTISGGQTTYCFILTRDPASLRLSGP